MDRLGVTATYVSLDCCTECSDHERLVYFPLPLESLTNIVLGMHSVTWYASVPLKERAYLG